jgi:primosomal protein N' (replication factor Y)
MFINVAFPIASYQEFTYAVPEDITAQIGIGSRVLAPLGNRKITGIVVSITDSSTFTGDIRSVLSLVDQQPILDEHLWELIKWMSRYYLTPIGQTAKAALPANLKADYEPPSRWLVEITKLKQKVDILELEKRAPVQAKIIRILETKSEPVPVTEFDLVASSPLTVCRILQDKGLVRLTRQILYPDVTGFTFEPIHKDIEFSESQQKIIDRLSGSVKKRGFNPVLLHGVTGSGKTEIYVEIARQVLEKERSVIILLPEITLTPQIAGRFRAIFGDRVALWHSKLTPAARAWTWKGMCRGDFNVVIGARSAIFAPLKDLGLIVVDEEQESSFKQDSPAPRYQARDVALMRGKMQDAIVLLTSATPSLESYYNQLYDKFSYHYLSERFGGAKYPQVRVVDMVKEWEETGKSDQILSGTLIDKIEDRLRNKEQILLLQNRRGFAPIMRCSDCGNVLMCPDCRMSLTYHSASEDLRCHFCGYAMPQLPQKCVVCESHNFRLQGTGTQKVESVIKESFPEVTIARLDVDSARSGKHIKNVLEQFSRHEIDILLGTKMIAKGLDFESVTLVGIINADTGLYLPDFRSAERTFQLIYQASGRSGRRQKPGEVVIQTYSFDDPVIKFASRLDLKSYYNIALSQRRELQYPPFSWMVKIEFTGPDRNKVEKSAQSNRKTMKGSFKGLEILGPAWCYRDKLRGQYRMQMILKSNKKVDPNGTRLHRFLHENYAAGEGVRKPVSRGVRMILDIDPGSLL